MSTNNSVMVFGPQGSGKSLHAKRMAQHYKCTVIVDENDSGDLWRAKDLSSRGVRVLFLTNDYQLFETTSRRFEKVAIADALRAIGVHQ